MNDCCAIPNKDRKSSFFITSLFVITIAYNSGSALMTINSELGVLLIFLSVLALLLKPKVIIANISLNKSNLLYLALILLPILSAVVNFNTNHFDSLIKFMLIITFSYFFTKKYEFNTYIYYFVKAMKIIVIFSLIPFFLYTIFSIDLYERLPVFTNINDVTYSIGLIINGFKNAYDFRNIGIFWEPSIYSTYIIIALVFEVSLKKTKPKLSSIIIFVVGLFTTQSTGGIALIFLIPLLFLHKKNNLVRSLLINIGIIMICFLGFINFNRIVSYASLVFPRIFFQLEKGMDNASIYSRVGSVGANLELFLERPIFGWGLGNYDLQFSKFGISQTSTSTYFLGVFGIFGIIFTIIMVLGVFKIRKTSFFESAMIVIIFLVAFNKESHFWLLNTYVLLFYLVKGMNKKDSSTRGVNDVRESICKNK